MDDVSCQPVSVCVQRSHRIIDIWHSVVNGLWEANEYFPVVLSTDI